jgi:deoxyhypusine synthase
MSLNDTPSAAKGAVLKSSDPVPDDAVPVKGLDFDAFAHRNITVAELVDSWKNVGFQATSVGQAVDIINDMVRRGSPSPCFSPFPPFPLPPPPLTSSSA